MDSGTALPGHRQIAGRFAQARDRLGSAEVYVRIGGVYSLEHVMRTSAEHHNDVVEALAAFIRARAARSTIARDHAAWPCPVVGAYPGGPPEPAPDVQAALTVLAHRPCRPERQKINLAGLRLAGAWLPGADLVRVWLMDADLTAAMLDHAILYRACLRDADLTRAHLDGADLTDAVLENAGLSCADLKNANLTEAYFGNADLSRADLRNANLTDAFFGNANLTCADLGSSDLNLAHFDGVDLTGAQLGPGALAVPAGWAVDPTGKLERESPRSVLAQKLAADAPRHRWADTGRELAAST